ncbi:MAG: UDP-N-acetylglucosamine--N-acetylmuramyl-(pentapeptide) pyrophosphoryl-undecaprenol N-acetylglucosamine transferase [Candidatus Omnitrophica bacterium]|nr:UDP-N-acetylglucosamine--N-acetylmuramyl-(pentapeptide) pyrophosphoryl-undecaprenol N-acetylglucosamine transferase [Candidatus Omnitrophota bacterium]MCM8802797.1 UDP-N-acetylglucosamine--N-acetylmuramyl-(pentapeptide) pyrophosphoryl-undecaprenol N-acetylglucosamine transferase [Candidatus Omnitrophota bacterium]
MKVIIITGPTGGHFFPGLAIGESLKNYFEIKFFVPEREYIINHLKKRNFQFIVIPSVKITKKNFIFSIFRFFFLIIFSIFLFLKEKPRIIIGTGSYVCVPFIIGSKILCKKIIIHEQNYIPSKTTKILSPFADFIFLTFPYRNRLPFRKCVITGFPLISDFKKNFLKEEIQKELGLENSKTLLLLGGSQGAYFINKLVVDNLDYFKEKKFQIIIIAGKDKDFVESKFKEKKIKGKVYDFFYEMNKLYTLADYVICRAGAGTIVEIVEKKIPAFLIPYPYAGGHQIKNALYLKRIGCGFFVEEREINSKNFTFLFEEFLKESFNIKENLKKIRLSDKGDIEKFILNFSKNKNGKFYKKI